MSPERNFDTKMRWGDEENVFIARKRFYVNLTDIKV